MGFDVTTTFMGHLQTEKTPLSGEGYATFSVTVREAVYDKESRKNKYETRYWDVKVFGKQVEILREIPKGTPVLVTGNLDRLSTWTSKEGVEGFNVGVIASSVRKCPPNFAEMDAEEELDDPMAEPEPVRVAPPRPSNGKAKVTY